MVIEEQMNKDFEIDTQSVDNEVRTKTVINIINAIDLEDMLINKRNLKTIMKISQAMDPM